MVNSTFLECPKHADYFRRKKIHLSMRRTKFIDLSMNLSEFRDKFCMNGK